MQGTLGHAAWRWLFFIEGGATMLVAVIAVFWLPDLPSNTRGFTDVERELSQLRLLEDVGEIDADNANQGAFDGLMMAVKDAKIYIMMLTLTAYVVGLSFNAFFVSHSHHLMTTGLTIAISHWNSRIRLRSHSPHVRSTMGFLGHCFRYQRMARR